jgi:DNA-binding response OmpR family regulator
MVDADHSLHMLFTTRLQRHVHDVLFATDGHEGLDMAIKLEPDLLIIDSDIPGLRAPDLLHQLRQMAWGKTVPVIIVTTSGFAPTSIEDSADLTLYRPVSTIEIIAIVKRLLHTTTGETVSI